MHGGKFKFRKCHWKGILAHGKYLLELELERCLRRVNGGKDNNINMDTGFGKGPFI